MREILFRGKRTDNGKWECGDLLSPNEFNAIPHIVYIDYLNEYGDIGEISAPILPETVGQFTGLTDKNGKRIFEGDIVTGYFNHEKIVGYVFYGGNAHFFIQRDGIYGIGLDNSDCWLEVIGNIHDKPELLEGGEGNG